MILVSAILPTRGRREYAKRAVECWRKQAYPTRELVILDDEQDPSFSVGQFDVIKEGILYTRHTERLTIAEKRNRCIQHASGDIIMHWDSDDWSAPDRMMQQVEWLEHSAKSVVAYHSMLFYDEDLSQALWYRGVYPTAIGTSLAFTYDWWKAHPFKPGKRNPNVGEDSGFSKQAEKENQLVTDTAGALMVARIHSGNTSPKKFDPASTVYTFIDRVRIPAGFFD